MTPLGGGRSGTHFAALDIQGWEPDGRAFQPAELFARGTQGRVLKAVDRPVPTDPTGERLAFDVKNAKVSALGTPAVKAAVVLPMGCQAAIGLG